MGMPLSAGSMRKIRKKDSRPSPGTITDLHLPGGEGIRVDSAIYSGCSISPYYDSMVAKLIVWAKNRDEAIQKMQSALGEVIIEGIDTNVDYLYELLNNPVYQSGEFNVNFHRCYKALKVYNNRGVKEI